MCCIRVQAANKQAQANIADFAPAQLPLLLCAFAMLGQEPGAALLTAVCEALTHQDLQVCVQMLLCNIPSCPEVRMPRAAMLCMQYCIAT